MQTRTRQSYHPYVLIAFYLNILPKHLLIQIPRSTRNDWKQKNLEQFFGYDWYNEQKHLFDTIQKVAENKHLLQLNTALLRIIAVFRFIQRHTINPKNNISSVANAIATNIQKIQTVLPLKSILKYLQLSYRQYWKMRQKIKCENSVFTLCLPKHPSQLLQREINIIKKYCNDVRFIHWPLASVYHQMIRDKAAGFNISTFYKYVALLQLKRASAKHRRKNHHTGIRVTAPLELLHTDVTIFKTADNIKAYIYLVQDNFSRTILGYSVSHECKAHHLFELLKKLYDENLHTNNFRSCLLMSDDGSENYGPVQEFLQNSQEPEIKHIVAQRDVEFSNSMIEAAHKSLKYRFLYHKHIPDLKSLSQILPKAIEDFNNRPHDVLNGLTPLEVLNGKTFDKNGFHQQVIKAKTARITFNKEQKCCSYSF